MLSKPHFGGREYAISGFWNGTGGRLHHRSESSLRARRGGPTKHESADVLALVTLVNLDADQMRLGAEPIHPPHAALPAAAHARAAHLVRLGDAALRARALPERVPLLGRDAGHERRVHGVEHVEVRQRRRRLHVALPAVLADEERRRGADRPDGDDPGQLRRAQEEARARGERWLRRRLRERDGREGRVHRAIDDCARRGGECDVVRDGGVM